MAMAPTLTANAHTMATSPFVAPVGLHRGRIHKLSRSAKENVYFQFRPFDIQRGQHVAIKSEAVGFCSQRHSTGRYKPVTTHSGRIQSASVICAAALSARCGAEQTQTVTREAPTITHIPGKEKSPQLDDGGSGFPPRDDGNGGGGGGGGGNWSGGFFLFGFLVFLGFLKDKESEGPYRNDQRR